MIKNPLSFSLVAATLWCGAAYAQDTQSQAEDVQTQTEVPQTEAGSELDLGESGPRVGDQYVSETVGDWDITCLKTETETDPCVMRQVLSGPEGQPIADITIRKLPETAPAAAAASVIVPLEVNLQAQLTLSIDGAPSKRYNYHHCNPVGCIVQLGFTQGDIDAMKAGRKATFSLVPVLAPNQLLDIQVSLAGFTAGFDKIEVNQP